MLNLANGYRLAGKLDRSLRLIKEALALMQAKLGPKHPTTLAAMATLANVYRDSGKHDMAFSLMEETVRLSEALDLLERAEIAGRDIPRLSWVKDQLLDGYIRAGCADKAVALIKVQVAAARAKLPAGVPQVAGMLAHAVGSLLRVKAWAEAEPLAREALTIREANEPDAWSTFNTQSLLGDPLLGQKKYADAEPLLRAGYEGLKQRANKIPPLARTRPAEALDRLIELAEATNKRDDVRTWKDERANLLTPTAPKSGTKKK
jgi:eukaryotic-like serine/threonine-protein kinase